LRTYDTRRTTVTPEDLQDIENNTCDGCGAVTPWLAEDGLRTVCSNCDICDECGLAHDDENDRLSVGVVLA
jgi:hypothetical protein